MYLNIYKDLAILRKVLWARQTSGNLTLEVAVHNVAETVTCSILTLVTVSQFILYSQVKICATHP